MLRQDRRYFDKLLSFLLVVHDGLLVDDFDIRDDLSRRCLQFRIKQFQQHRQVGFFDVHGHRHLDIKVWFEVINVDDQRVSFLVYSIHPQNADLASFIVCYDML